MKFYLFLLIMIHTLCCRELMLLSGRVLLPEIRVPCGTTVRGTGSDTVLNPNALLLGGERGGAACNITIENVALANIVQRTSALVPAADGPRYFYVRLRNVSMTRCVLALAGSVAVGGEVTVEDSRVEHSRLTLARLVVAGVAHCDVAHSRLTIAHNDVARVVSSVWTDVKLQLHTEAEPDRLVPHLIDVVGNEVRRSIVTLACAHTHVLTHAHGGGLAAFALGNGTAIGDRCHIEWAMPPSYAIPVRPPPPLFYTL